MNSAIAPGQRVRVNVNLHRRQLAVCSPPHGRVTAYVNDITLSAVRFRFQPACADKVRRRGVRAVCAYAVGVVEALDTRPPAQGRRVAYNPLRRKDFHDPVTGEQIDGAALVVFVDLRAYVLDVTPTGSASGGPDGATPPQTPQPEPVRPTPNGDHR